MTSVQIRSWHHDLGEHAVGGSVYSVKLLLDGSRPPAGGPKPAAGSHADLILSSYHRHSDAPARQVDD